MGTFDVYRMTDNLDKLILDTIVRRLEDRGNNQFFQRMMHEYLDAMDIDAARTVLDVGCGTGVATRGIAHRASFSGTVTGIDLSPYLVETAQKLAREEGIEHQVDFLVGDTRSLDIPDNEFPAVVAHTLVSHVDDVAAVINEIARVVKPGGIVGIFDGDYATLSFSNDDPVKGKEYDEAIISAVITNPRVMRQMPRLLNGAGLELVESFSYVLAEVGKADFWLSSIESFRRLLPASGVMQEEQINEWVDARLKDSEDGAFFGASNYYGYVARRL